MKYNNTHSFIEHLHQTHKAEWEATPSTLDAVAWLCALYEFLFPNNQLHKQSTYEGILKKNQIDLENILLSYLDPKQFDIEKPVEKFYEALEVIYESLRADAAKIYEN